MRIVHYTYPAQRRLATAPAVFSRSPWSGLESEIGRLFETALGDFSPADGSARFPLDLYEDQAHTYVRAELPGVNREDINVEVVDGYLNITATRKTPATDAQAAQSSSFRRSVNIPAEVEADKVGATYENGVLTVTLPKREEVKPKKINVTVS